jgi:glutathione S-transferase
LKIFETQIANNRTGYLVGNSLTVADINFSVLMDLLGDKKDEVLAHVPGLKGLCDRVYAIPTIANWLRTRPVTPI